MSAVLHRHNILSDASEVQGMLCGMLAGGMDPKNPEWQGTLCDFINAGEGLSREIVAMTNTVFEQLVQQLHSDDFGLELCLPDDDAPAAERGQGIIAWIQGFLLGFGVERKELKACSEDVKEALKDFADIVQMDSNMADSEESEQALYEVIEYVRISAILCFSELGYAVPDNASSLTLH